MTVHFQGECLKWQYGQRVFLNSDPPFQCITLVAVETGQGVLVNWWNCAIMMLLSNSLFDLVVVHRLLFFFQFNFICIVLLTKAPNE